MPTEQKTISNELAAKLFRDKVKGYTYKELKELYNLQVHESTVCRAVVDEMIRRGIVYISKNELIQLYVKEGKSIKVVADVFLCGAMTIWRMLKKYNIKTRSRGNPKLKKSTW